MKGLRILRRSVQLLSARRRPCYLQYQRALSIRLRPIDARLASSPAIQEDSTETSFHDEEVAVPPADLTSLPSPPPAAALKSAKLSALHARLALPPRLPLQTLARTLVDPSADPSDDFNNASLASLGNDLLGYYASEAIICRYPRLPLTVIFAAMFAYTGPKTLASITREWGVEVAAEPGGEVDPGLLQLKRLKPGEQPVKGGGSGRPNEKYGWRRGMSSRIVYDDHFGDVKTSLDIQERPELGAAPKEEVPGATVEAACTGFVRSVMAAVYLHAGRPAAKAFFQQHFLSRQLDMSALFDFKEPTRDLSRLCAKEGFESPIARRLSETGRNSRHPVFVVGVFSGVDKLGEAAGGSLDEARTRAAVAALKGWYLYSPLDVKVPSDTEGPDAVKDWKPVMIDGGEVVV
ncbi:MAG: hypothetical protein M1836_005160 [Candelina mexicana]|nr:MAG: hypothetical protein M1836_005160 [Candelina mexicana]